MWDSMWKAVRLWISSLCSDLSRWRLWFLHSDMRKAQKALVFILLCIYICQKKLNVSLAYLRITLVHILATHLLLVRKRIHARQIFYYIVLADVFNNLRFAGNATQTPQVAKVPQVSQNSNVTKTVPLQRETPNLLKHLEFLRKFKRERRRVVGDPWFTVTS